MSEIAEGAKNLTKNTEFTNLSSSAVCLKIYMKNVLHLRPFFGHQHQNPAKTKKFDPNPAGDKVTRFDSFSISVGVIF